MVVFFCDDGYPGVCEGRDVRSNALEAKLDERLPGFILAVPCVQGAAVRTVFQGFKNIIEDKLSVGQAVGNVSGIPGGILGGIGKVDRNNEFIHI
jgi:hypothetical protein